MRSTDYVQHVPPYNTLNDIPKASYARRDMLLIQLNQSACPIEDIIHAFVDLRQQHPFQQNNKNLYILHKILDMAFISQDQWKFLSIFISLVTQHRKHFEDEFLFAHSPHHHGSGTPIEMLQTEFHYAFVQVLEILREQNVSHENPYTELLRLRAQLAESQARLSDAEKALQTEKTEHIITTQRLFKSHDYIATLENELAETQNVRKRDASTLTGPLHSIWHDRAKASAPVDEVSLQSDLACKR